MKYLFSTLLIACVSVLMSAQPKLNLNTGSVDIEWQQEEDGWHISCIKIDGKQIPSPKGYYTILYLDRNPAKDLVDQDLEGKDFTFYPSKAEMLPDGALKFSHSLRFGDVEAIWKVDPSFPSDIKVDMKVRLSTNGSVSIATPTIAVFEENNISWAMIPGNWYGKEIQYDLNMAKTYSMGIPCVPMLAQERNTMTLCPLYSSKDGYTLAVVPDPGTETDPIVGKAPDKSPNSLGLSLANRHNELTPVVYHPVLGQVGAKNKAGDEVSFGFRYTLKNSGWFDVFQHAVNDVFALPSSLDLLTNKMSLSERVNRLQKFLRKDKESSWKTWQSRGETIGANGSKIADAGTMFMIARNGQDSVMNSRLHYVRNYKMIQQQTEPGYFCGAALGEYADIDGVESERGNWIEPLHTTYYTMVDFGNMLLFNPDDKELLERLRMAGDRLLAWQKGDGSFEVGYDRFSMKPSFPDLKDYRPTWYGLYIAYKHLNDKKYLDAACKGADWQQKNGVDKGYYLGVCGDGRNIWDFCTAQTSRAYMDLYEITGNEAYKQASIDAAMIYATSIFTNPVMTDKTKYIGEQAYKDWELNQTGLGVEHIRGTAVNGPILISSYAGLFVKMYEWTKEPVFLTMARAASIGRNAFVDQESGCAVYYWHGMNELKKYSTMFPWHAYWQIGWIVDYLIAEADLRSDSNISFPYGYMTPKVGPHVTYGFAPGNIYGKKADLLFRPDMVSCDNPEIEFLTALSENGKKLYLIAMCQSNDSHSCTVTLDLSQLVANKTGFRSAKALQGKIIRSVGKKGQINLDFAPWGMNVIEISL